MYVQRGVRGIGLDFQRGLDYFPVSVPAADRAAIMHAFLQRIRGAIDAATAPGDSIALGLRLTPSWATLRSQGLADLNKLVRSLADGGDGVTYLNWGTYFWARQPFDSEIESLVAATPSGTPFYIETSSWVGEGPRAPACSYSPKIRITKEELWTTALLARYYGAAGISAFNFIYTRPYYDNKCAFEINKPFSEPLFAALGSTRNSTFLECCADQFYRLSPTYDPVGGQMGRGGLPLVRGAPAMLHMVAVPPLGGWQKQGRLRLLTSSVLPPGASLNVTINGHPLRPASNTSSVYSEGVQATLAKFPQVLWSAWEVDDPAIVMRRGNNSISVQLLPSLPSLPIPDPSHDGSTALRQAGGLGGPVPASEPAHVPRGPLNDTNLASDAFFHSYHVYANKTAGALACQDECDADAKCAAWTYVTGRAGSSPAPGVERCCHHAVRGCPLRQQGMYSGAKNPGPCVPAPAPAPPPPSPSLLLVKLELSLPVA